ncbi:MAG: glutathione S-transferase [Rhodobacterales bacterium]|nr:MAG: glutathione S-transferase [Rhodobacterales bacterium]
MLEDFPITQRWPAKDPSVIQLYSFPTPNGVKVSAMLEECGLAYEAHAIRFSEADQFTPEFLSLNPNNKIPAIIDPDGPGGAPMGLFESGAILVYLAEKTGKFLPSEPQARYQVLQWLMWQMGGFGPMLGQFGYFQAFAGKEIEDRRPWTRYKEESERLLDVLDGHLEGREFVAGGEYSVADMAIWPWVRVIGLAYEAWEVLELDNRANVIRWYEACANRPASKRAVNVPPRG